jgi:hypothetical protein
VLTKLDFVVVVVVTLSNKKIPLYKIFQNATKIILNPCAKKKKKKKLTLPYLSHHMPRLNTLNLK